MRFKVKLSLFFRFIFLPFLVDTKNKIKGSSTDTLESDVSFNLLAQISRLASSQTPSSPFPNPESEPPQYLYITNSQCTQISEQWSLSSWRSRLSIARLPRPRWPSHEEMEVEWEKNDYGGNLAFSGWMHFGTQRLIVSDTLWPVPACRGICAVRGRAGGGGGVRLCYHVAVILQLNNLQLKRLHWTTVYRGKKVKLAFLFFPAKPCQVI